MQPPPPVCSPGVGVGVGESRVSAVGQAPRRTRGGGPHRPGPARPAKYSGAPGGLRNGGLRCPLPPCSSGLGPTVAVTRPGRLSAGAGVSAALSRHQIASLGGLERFPPGACQLPGETGPGRDGVRLARGAWGRPKYFAVSPDCSEPLLAMWPPLCGLFRPCPYGSQVQRWEEEMEEDQHSFENES